MHIFVTGASGFIGSAVVQELIGAGHQVTGLVRSDAAAATVAALGAGTLRGDLHDLDALQHGARGTDGVIHLAFDHDFSKFAETAEHERVAIEAIGRALEGSGKSLAIASGVLGLRPDFVATERDVPDPAVGPVSPRQAGVLATQALTDRGVRAVIVRLAPSVHDDGTARRGFVVRLIELARQSGVSGYVGGGVNRWSAVHRLDAASLFRLAAEKAPAGAVLHGVADEGVALRRIAEVIGAHLDVPVRSFSPEEAPEHFGLMTPMVSADAAASSAYTQELLDWKPTHPSLLEDLEGGCYFDAAASRSRRRRSEPALTRPASGRPIKDSRWNAPLQGADAV